MLRYDQALFEPVNSELGLIHLVDAQFWAWCVDHELGPSAFPEDKYKGLLQVFFDGWRMGATGRPAPDDHDLRRVMLETIESSYKQENDEPWVAPDDALALALEPVFAAGWQAGQTAVAENIVTDARN